MQDVIIPGPVFQAFLMIGAAIAAIYFGGSLFEAGWSWALPTSLVVGILLCMGSLWVVIRHAMRSAASPSDM